MSHKDLQVETPNSDTCVNKLSMYLDKVCDNRS